ncbi:MAG: tetratricopeptide repeat protein, partial [Pyrinomonadaceae bacterium]
RGKMRFKKVFTKFALTVVILSSINYRFVIVTAQDIVTSDDISNGASVFVFRESKKKPQVKLSSKNTFVAVRSNKNVQSRKNSQIASVRKRKPSPINSGSIVARKTPAKKTANSKIALSNTLTAKAQKLFESKQNDPAIETFREALKNNANNEAAANGLSDALTAKGIQMSGDSKDETAIPIFNEAVKYDTKNGVAYGNLGDIHFAKDRNRQAIENYEKALAVAPEINELFVPLGLAYVKEGEIAKAEIQLSKTDSLNKNEIETEYLRGLIFYKQNKNDQALAAFNKTISLDPNNVLANYYQAAVYDRLNQRDKAVAGYKKTTDIDPGFAPAYFDLGVTYYNEGEYDGAENAYKQTVKVENGNSEAHANLASTHRQQEHYVEANAEYKNAAEGIKNNADLYSEWGYCLGKVSEWDKAVARLETAKDIKPDESVYTNIGWAYFNAGQTSEKNEKKTEADADYEKSKTALQKAVEINPRYAAAHLNLGSTYNALNDFQSAVNSLNQAVSLKSDWVIAINELGLAYRGSNDLTNAVQQFQRVVKLDNDFALGFYNLGATEYKRGNKKEAQKAQKRLKILNPALAQKLDNVIAGRIIEEGKQKIKNKIPKIPF